MIKNFKHYNKSLITISLTLLIMLNSCGIYKKTDSRKIPTNANERIEKNGWIS